MDNISIICPCETQINELTSMNGQKLLEKIADAEDCAPASSNSGKHSQIGPSVSYVLNQDKQ